MENPISAPGFVCKNLCFGFKSKKGGGWPAHRGLAIHRDVILVNAAVHRTAAPSFACREACEAGTRFKSPIWQQAKRIPSPKGEGILFGRSVIIGFQKTQIYQRFTGSQQEVFILKFQNDENNAAQQDNGRRCSFLNVGTNCPKLVPLKHGPGGISPRCRISFRTAGSRLSRVHHTDVYRRLALDWCPRLFRFLL